MLTGPNVILTLKVAVLSVTVLLLISLLALARGKYRLHGRINVAFFVLTAIALIGLEIVVRLVDPEIFSYFDTKTGLKQSLITHLCFSLPATGIMPLMLWTGLTHKRELHLYLAGIFSVLWVGTFVTGIFFLPHTL